MSEAQTPDLFPDDPSIPWTLGSAEMGGPLTDGRHRYRYWLTRNSDAWNGDLGDRVGFMMLNPSTADHATNDPTITRCIGFARSWGFGSLVVVNGFAFRATDPDDLFRAMHFCDPVGPYNLRHITEQLTGLPLVVCAWSFRGLPKALERRVMEILRDLKGPADPDSPVCQAPEIMCLGVTKNGEPRHPLYVRGDAELVPFPPRSSP